MERGKERIGRGGEGGEGKLAVAPFLLQQVDFSGVYPSQNNFSINRCQYIMHISNCILKTNTFLVHSLQEKCRILPREIMFAPYKIGLGRTRERYIG